MTPEEIKSQILAAKSTPDTNVELKERALSGDAEAAFLVGQKYFDAVGYEFNEEEALLWFRMASDQGHALAMYYAGGKILCPNNVCEQPFPNKNFIEGFKMLHRSAELGLFEAIREIDLYKEMAEDHDFITFDKLLEILKN